MYEILQYPVVFLVGFTVTYLLTPLVRRCANTIGMIDIPDRRRIHISPIPNAGGLAIFVGFQMICAFVFMNPWQAFHGILSLQWWHGFLITSTLLLLVGIVDDIWAISPVFKLIGQAVVAALSFYFGMRVGNILGIHLPLPLDLIFTMIWIMALVNAFNLIDGMDGLAVGLAAIASGGIAGALLFRHLSGDALITIGLLGCCVAFLRYNFHPATIFLGDSGSMFLGYTLATIALGTGSKGTAAASLGVPLLAVGVPVFDTLLAMWRRSVRGINRLSDNQNASENIMQADLDHIHHRLLKSGLSQDKVAVGLYSLNATLVLVGLISLVYHSKAVGIYLIAFVTASYVVVKHLARIELWDSGYAILHGLRRPPGKVRAVIAYPVLDAVFLIIALAVAVSLADSSVVGLHLSNMRSKWFESIPIYVGIPILFLAAMKTYNRVWSRARISEYVLLGLTLAGSILLSCGVDIVLLGDSLQKGLIVQAILYAGLAIPLLTGSRAFLRTIQDWVSMEPRYSGESSEEPVLNTVVYGAGKRGVLFLEEKSYLLPTDGKHRRIVGYLDDDRNLRKRLIYGYQVLGDIGELPNLIDEYGVNEIVVTATLAQANRERLYSLANERRLALSEWRIQENSIIRPNDAGSRDVAGTG